MRELSEEIERNGGATLGGLVTSPSASAVQSNLLLASDWAISRFVYLGKLGWLIFWF